MEAPRAECPPSCVSSPGRRRWDRSCTARSVCRPGCCGRPPAGRHLRSSGRPRRTWPAAPDPAAAGLRILARAPRHRYPCSACLFGICALVATGGRRHVVDTRLRRLRQRRRNLGHRLLRAGGEEREQRCAERLGNASISHVVASFLDGVGSADGIAVAARSGTTSAHGLRGAAGWEPAAAAAASAAARPPGGARRGFRRRSRCRQHVPPGWSRWGYWPPRCTGVCRRCAGPRQRRNAGRAGPRQRRNAGRAGRGIAICTVDFGPLAILSCSSSTSSPCFRLTRSGLTSATTMPLSVSPRCTVCDLPPFTSRRKAVATLPITVVPVNVYSPFCIVALGPLA